MQIYKQHIISGHAQSLPQKINVHEPIQLFFKAYHEISEISKHIMISLIIHTLNKFQTIMMQIYNFTNVC